MRPPVNNIDRERRERRIEDANASAKMNFRDLECNENMIGTICRRDCFGDCYVQHMFIR